MQSELPLIYVSDGEDYKIVCQTHPLLPPIDCVPDDVVASLVVRAEHLRQQHIVLRQPDLQLLVPPPIAIVPLNVSLRSVTIMGLNNLQFTSRQMLLDVIGRAVENPHQGLLVEARDLVLNRLDIGHVVAFGESELWYGRSRWYIVEERVDLGGNRAVDSQHMLELISSPGSTDSLELISTPRVDGSMPQTRAL